MPKKKPGLGLPPKGTAPRPGAGAAAPPEGTPPQEARHDGPMIPLRNWVCPDGKTGSCRKKLQGDAGPFYATKDHCESTCKVGNQLAPKPPTAGEGVPKAGGVSPSKAGGGRKRKPSANFLAASARWRAHLADYREKHPKQSLKKQMQGAKASYRKSSQVKGISVRPKTRRTRKTKRRVTRKKKKSGLFGF